MKALRPADIVASVAFCLDRDEGKCEIRQGSNRTRGVGKIGQSGFKGRKVGSRKSNCLVGLWRRDAVLANSRNGKGAFFVPLLIGNRENIFAVQQLVDGNKFGHHALDDGSFIAAVSQAALERREIVFVWLRTCSRHVEGVFNLLQVVGELRIMVDKEGAPAMKFKFK
jgi:hypothetical protein